MPYEIDTDRDVYRSPWRAMGRGLKSRCPQCGQGNIFYKYLKTAENCNSCGEYLKGHRADDAPSYFAMLFLSMLIAPIMVTVQLIYELPLWVSFTIWIPLSLILVIAILQPVKGAIIALQWANRMHGFDEVKPDVGFEDDKNVSGSS